MRYDFTHVKMAIIKITKEKSVGEFTEKLEPLYSVVGSAAAVETGVEVSQSVKTRTTTETLSIGLISVKSASSRDQHQVPCMATFPGLSVSYLVANALHWTAFIMKEVALCSYWNRQFGYRFTFPAYNASVITIIQGSTGCLIHGHGVSHILLVIKESLQKLSVAIGPCSRNSLILPYSPSP